MISRKSSAANASSGSGWLGDAAAASAGTGFLSRTLQLLHTPEGHAG